MMDEVVDGIRCLSDLGSCGRTEARWYGRTRAARILLIVNRLLRRACVLMLVAGLVAVMAGAPTLAIILIGLACGVTVLTYIPEFVLTGRGLIVPGPAKWPPKR